MQGSSFRLIVRRGPQPNKIYELDKNTITLGRDITNELVINDPEVSRHHCRLTRGGGGFTVEDVGSTNGTFVNGQRLTGAYPLSHGDMLGLGETVTLAYEAVVDPRQAATMVGGSAPGSEYAPPAGSPYGQPAAPSAPYGYPPVQPQQPYGPPIHPSVSSQQPMPYEYEYQDEPNGGGAGRWVILSCGCFLVLCIVTSIIGGIIIDAKCWWDDIPVISDVFDLGIKENATCR